ncbi:Phosphoglycolate phosphatase (plasmid) [Pseudoseohaeicola sp. NH-UV-7]|uniref:phosphoglycolate phosphatase n=1 Tax=Sulfitobacter sp. TBRI5 TaxID=2989732 RepID=UPI003A6B170A
MQNTKAIIFDLDGTLIHSAPDLHSAANAALAPLGRGPLDLETVTSFIGNGVDKLVERSLRATGDFDDGLMRQTLDRFHGYYRQNMTTLTRPYPGVMAALDAFRAAGLRMGVCTNKPAGPARAICDEMGLSQYFDIVAGAEEGKPKKPDATPLLQCVDALGCAAHEVVYVGDSTVDFETARNASVTFVLFEGGYLNGPPLPLPPEQRFASWAQHGLLPSK